MVIDSGCQGPPLVAKFAGRRVEVKLSVMAWDFAVQAGGTHFCDSWGVPKSRGLIVKRLQR